LVTREPDDHWSVLGIPPDASLDDIERAYRDLARVWHPDKFSSDPRLQKIAEEKTKEINDAYQLLKSRYTGASNELPKYRSGPTRSDQTTATSTSPKASSQRDAGSPPHPSQVPTWLIVAGTIAILRFLAGLAGTPSEPVINSPTSPSQPIMPPVVREVTQEPAIKQEGPSNATSQPTSQKTQPSTITVKPVDRAKEPVNKGLSLSNVNYFGIGSTKDKVRTIQGTPTSIHKGAYTETWWYGPSYVEFDQSGRVRAYSNTTGNLRVR
jgi:hypothetical protein